MESIAVVHLPKIIDSSWTHYFQANLTDCNNEIIKGVITIDTEKLEYTKYNFGKSNVMLSKSNHSLVGCALYLHNKKIKSF
jgi:hypothetical protein